MGFFSTFSQIDDKLCVPPNFFCLHPGAGAGAAKEPLFAQSRSRSRPREKGAGAAKMGRLRNPDYHKTIVITIS